MKWTPWGWDGDNFPSSNQGEIRGRGPGPGSNRKAPIDEKGQLNGSTALCKGSFQQATGSVYDQEFAVLGGQ
jgi:hypothetical protein